MAVVVLVACCLVFVSFVTCFVLGVFCFIFVWFWHRFVVVLVNSFGGFCNLLFVFGVFVFVFFGFVACVLLSLVLWP